MIARHDEKIRALFDQDDRLEQTTDKAVARIEATLTELKAQVGGMSKLLTGLLVSLALAAVGLAANLVFTP